MKLMHATLQIFQKITKKKYKKITHQRLWCNFDFMMRCLPICNIEDILQEGNEGKLWLQHKLAW